jgi:hypothetical protein
MKKLITLFFIVVLSINVYGLGASVFIKGIGKKVIGKTVMSESKEIYDITLKKLKKEYGDSVYKIFDRHGVKGVKIVKIYGKRGIKNINKYGDEFINVEERFPGLGLDIVETYGDNFAEIVYKKNIKSVLIDIKSNKFITSNIKKYVKSPEEIDVYKRVKTKVMKVNGRPCLVRDDIDINILDNKGLTNLERMKMGLAPIDEAGRPYNLHHIGQQMDSPFVELKEAEHIEYSEIIHKKNIETQIDRSKYAIQRLMHWKEEAKRLLREKR